jgi:hypothetical protein
LDPNFKSIQTASKFKQTLRANLFKVSNYYLLGNRKCNIIHTRLRHHCSCKYSGAILLPTIQGKVVQAWLTTIQGKCVQAWLTTIQGKCVHAWLTTIQGTCVRAWLTTI